LNAATAFTLRFFGQGGFGASMKFVVDAVASGGGPLSTHGGAQDREDGEVMISP